jgi:hypothetical protein
VRCCKLPCVSSLDAFHKAVAKFVVENLGLMIEPAALDSSDLLLLGEMLCLNHTDQSRRYRHL